MKTIPNHKNNYHAPIRGKNSEKPTRYQYFGGGKPLLFSLDESFPYALSDIDEQQYQWCEKSQKQNLAFDDGGVLCSVPLNILAPKLILKAAKELANLHNMYMPSKILLQNHKCETCVDLLAAFKPYNVVSNTEHQQT